ncbi:heterokaryon incompatibility protein-domain-containing protein [Plectosphaerella plurivora]|uniref:Heterokaryon incompatibility protein-domain-containing protein n=1 Tax=Plectosphaerella plurivora TaxID=936078 RepID=A0A9P8V3P1_9PEZI|nr:heterokaryon incompatibility protein-domain-containing protein [Plectosphaerella plurivora]
MSYQYEPLSNPKEQLRLMKLEPGRPEDPIIFWLQPVTVLLPDDAKLSSRYSDEATTATTTTDSLPSGCSSMETMSKRTLYKREDTGETSWEHPDPTSALADQRQPPSHSTSSATPRTLWVDAVCINQTDNAEKSHQVARMDRIYRLAYRVVVWLGTSGDGSDKAMAALRYLGEQVELSRNSVRARAPGASEPDWYRSEVQLPYTDDVYEAIGALFRRSYFERLWILQEILLSSPETVVYCGTSESPWPALLRAIVCLVTRSWIPAELRRTFDFVRPLTWHHEDLSVPFMLGITRTRKCYNLKDKIYGILGMAAPGFRSLVETNYSPEVHVEQVCKSAFLAYCRFDVRLTLLQECDLDGRKLPGPSWVPDWTSARRTQPLSAFVCAAGISQAHFEVESDDILAVRGRRVAVIASTSPAAPENAVGALRKIQTWEPADLLTASYVAGGSLLDAFLTTLRVGYLAERWTTLRADTLEGWRSHYLNKLYSKLGPIDEAEADEGEVYWATKLVKRRSFVRTTAGHAGLASADAEPGDVVCALLGCKASIMLRPQPDGTFTVVGECFIHGLDDSTGIVGQMPPGWTVHIDKDDAGNAEHRYINAEEGLSTVEDPRLGALPAEWSRHRKIRRPGAPALAADFRNVVTGEEMNSDPRLLPKNLLRRGIELETLRLR